MTEHQTTPNDPIERELASLSAWRGERTELWRSALERVEGERARPGVLARITARPWRAAAAIALGGIIITIAAVVSESTSHQPEAAERLAYADGVAPAEAPPRAFARRALEESFRSQMVTPDLLLGREVALAAEGPTEQEFAFAKPAGESARAVSSGPAFADAPEARQVVRRASLEIVALDVGAAAALVQAGLDAGRGDLIERSERSGEGTNAGASLTIRARSDRLDDVLAGVRSAGRVRSESVTAEDVTAQVVDLEARLRNEQRFERDLLELSSNRADAPLDHVLEVRRAVAEVRERIERLTAQRQRIGRDVAMSTVHVSIRPERVDAPERHGLSLGEYVGKGLRSAWQRGLVRIADTAAWLVRVLVGGAVWWVLLAAAVIGARGWRKRRRRRPRAG